MITDLDKYGLVALTIVVVLILFIAMNDMGEDPDLNLNGVYFTDSDPTKDVDAASQDEAVVVLDNPAAGAPTPGEARQKEFDFLEAPAQYPGRPATTPATASRGSNRNEQPSVNIHRVKKGDTLSLISKRYYGSVKWWKVIADANPKVKPSKLVIGDRIRIPMLAQQAGSANAAGSIASQTKISESRVKSRTYRVRNGDTLGKIAKSFYGNSGKWEKIFAANKKKIRDPKRLRVGVELDIPR